MTRLSEAESVALTREAVIDALGWKRPTFPRAPGDRSEQTLALYVLAAMMARLAESSERKEPI